MFEDIDTSGVRLELVDIHRFKSGIVKHADALKAIWLEVRTARPAEMKEKILAFGVKEVEHWDKQHFYFQAPNGQVFRLATNDMVDGWGLKK